VKNSRSHGNQGGSHGNQSGSHGNQSGSHGNQSGPSWGEGVAPKKKDREEENIRRLFSVNSATEEFNQWCDRELKKFSTDVDAQTFVSFLLEVDSVYEVHDYIKSYLGETDEAHEFAKSFLDRRQKIKSTNNPPPASQGKKSRPKNNSSANAELSPADPIKMGGASGVGGVASSSEGSGGGGGMSRSSKKKKKKMQKVNPAALLGFTVNAGERPNMGGEIQSAKDAV
jgi:PERQ amino acid-rich with GYF domain-containing protein